MNHTLVLTDALVAELTDAAHHGVETGGVLIATIATAPDGAQRFLGRRMVWTPEAAYLKRTSTELLVSSDGYVPALGEAARLGAMAFWVHTHPGEDSAPIASRYDHKVDEQLADVFRLRTGVDVYGALIISPREAGLAFSATVFHEDGRQFAIDRLWQVGESFRMTGAFNAPGRAIPTIYDRSVRAFGAGVQQALGAMKVGIVGLGGTGSAVCEQLARLGVKRFALIDADELTDSNVTRVYGSAPPDVGLSKVQIAAANVTAIAPDARCDTVKGMITLEHVARRLIGCDVIFGCTDDNAGRLVLSRFATFLMTPVIDVGVLLSSDAEGILTGIDGRITVLAPGSACLVCRKRIDLARAAAELHTPEERRRLADEGYAPALERVEPAVVAYTSAVASAAVGELVERLVGYGPAPRPSEVLLRLHEREISTNHMPPRTGHYCDPAVGKVGCGVSSPFLEQTWPTN